MTYIFDYISHFGYNGAMENLGIKKTHWRSVWRPFSSGLWTILFILIKTHLYKWRLND